MATGILEDALAYHGVQVDVHELEDQVDVLVVVGLDDAALEELIRKAGYSLVSVDRNVAK